MLSTMTPDLFDHLPQQERQAIGSQAYVLRAFAFGQGAALVAAINEIEQQAAFRNMVTPGGFTMSVAMTNCGSRGWVADRHGYRYASSDPLTGRPWPPMPEIFRQLARDAAAQAGFAGFEPDACLLNRYLPGARLTLHQDKDESNDGAPIVSVSLGMSAVFLFGGNERSDKASRTTLLHGDVVVWGGVDRLRYHGILPLKDNPHSLLGSCRINLTFRLAG